MRDSRNVIAANVRLSLRIEQQKLQFEPDKNAAFPDVPAIPGSPKRAADAKPSDAEVLAFVIGRGQVSWLTSFASTVPNTPISNGLRRFVSPDWARGDAPPPNSHCSFTNPGCLPMRNRGTRNATQGGSPKTRRHSMKADPGGLKVIHLAV